MTPTSFNAEMAARFDEVADLLEVQGADWNRIRAYREAATTLRRLPESVADIYETGGVADLIAIPTIGRALALAVADVVETGTWRWLERLRGDITPEDVFTTVPGIGRVLAGRIHDELGIESLEELELAAHDGRLAQVEGFGSQRVRGVVDSLAGRLMRRRWVDVRKSTEAEPRPHDDLDVPFEDELLDVDREYRHRVAGRDVPKIAPRRFNPSGEAWLPVLHTQRGDRHYTVMYSNTARAHALGRSKDWVVIYKDGSRPGQWTVVTETRGRRTGERVVRGLTADRLRRQQAARAA